MCLMSSIRSRADRANQADFVYRCPILYVPRFGRGFGFVFMFSGVMFLSHLAALADFSPSSDNFIGLHPGNGYHGDLTAYEPSPLPQRNPEKFNLRRFQKTLVAD